MAERTHALERDVLVACAKRELAMRRAVYPRRVADRKMTQEKADLEIDAMEAIVGVLENYPLAHVAREAVRAVLEDLEKRAGFRDLLREAEDMPAIREAMIMRVEQATAHRQVTPKVETAELEFE